MGVAIALVGRSAVAHDRLMRRIGAQDGLSPQAIVALAQDERGFVWIGTYWKGGQCVTLADGTVWTHVARRIVRLRPDGAPEWFEVPAGDADPVTTIHHRTSAGGLARSPAACVACR